MKKPTLLIVDDEQDICQIASSIICKCFNVNVVFAMSIEEALVLLHKITPDFALLDIQLGDGEGYDLVPKLKELNPEVKMLFISAYSGDKVFNKVKTLGAVDLIHKPFDTVILKSKLREMMEINGDE